MVGNRKNMLSNGCDPISNCGMPGAAGDSSQRPSISTNTNIVTKTEPAGSRRLRGRRLGEFESATKGSVSAILVHPSRLFSEGLRRILAETPFELAWLAAAADQVPQKFRNTGRRLFFIVGGKDAADRDQSVRAILRQHTSARIVVIANCSGASEVMSALEAGAGGYIRETISCESLLKALELVMLNETVLPGNFIKELPSWIGPIHGTTPPALPGTTPPALPGTTPPALPPHLQHSRGHRRRWPRKRAKP